MLLMKIYLNRIFLEYQIRTLLKDSFRFNMKLLLAGCVFFYALPVFVLTQSGVPIESIDHTNLSLFDGIGFLTMLTGIFAFILLFFELVACFIVISILSLLRFVNWGLKKAHKTSYTPVKEQVELAIRSLYDLPERVSLTVISERDIDEALPILSFNNHSFGCQLKLDSVIYAVSGGLSYKGFNQKTKSFSRLETSNLHFLKQYEMVQPFEEKGDVYFENSVY